MATYAVYADWRLDEQVTDEVLAVGATALPIDDPEACVWRDESDSTVVRLSFDLEAGALESAIEQARSCVGQFSNLGLPGVVTRIELIDDDDFWT